LLPAYYFLFESGNSGFGDRLKKTALQSLPAVVLCVLLYELQAKRTSSTYITGGTPFNYIITQPFVMLHYFANFFIPTSLSADSDWIPFESLSDYRFWVGLLFLLILLGVIAKQIIQKRNAAVTFGLAWFLIALLPSSLVPLSEVMNDYRPFIAYIGIAIAAGWCTYWVWQKWVLPNGQYVRLFMLFLAFILLINTYGTFARNKVWTTEEGLWLDVTEKSPENGRGLMNYGLTQMNKGNYATAEDCFTRGLKILPRYSYLYANMAVLKGAEKKYDEAEDYYKKAIFYGQGIPVISYFYARFLHQQGRDNEALPYVKQAIEMSPADVYSRYLAMEIYQAQEDFTDMAEMAKQTLVMLPGDAYAQSFLTASSNTKTKLEKALELVRQNPTADNYVNLSLIYFDKKQYGQCIEMCKEAIRLNPKYAAAYNNMGTAFNMLGYWDDAKAALKQAMDLQPGFQLAQNNYNVAVKQQAITDSMVSVVTAHPTAENYVSISLIYYRQGLFLKSADANKEAIKINPSFAIAYNNLCAVYNNLQMWDDAITAGEKAVQLDPNSQLYKNNLATSKQGKANSGK
jgi:tetratricopeptide (TPR) repeat protein